MYRITLILFGLLIGLSMPAVASNVISMPETKAILDDIGFGEDEVQKLLSGEIEFISKDRKEGTEKELAVAIGMLLPVPVAKVAEFVRGSKLFELDKEVISSLDLGDKLPNKDTFRGVKFEAGEAAEIGKLLKIKPGSDFNFSKAEIDRLKKVAGRMKKVGTEKDLKVLEAVNAEHSAILMDRYLAYRKGGLSAIVPYDRGGGKMAKPGEELIGVAERDELMRNGMPNFYRAFRNYPNDGIKDMENHFILIKLTAENRPTFVLAHRMHWIGIESAVLTERQFYVGHSYNSLNILVACITIKKGTLVLYENRTSTDQVAGFGGGLKRGIGRKMMRDKLFKFFKDIRKSIKQ